MAEYKEWSVILTYVSEHNYNVNARTEEEAIDTAMTLYDEGDEGEVLDVSLDETIALSSDQQAVIEEMFEDEGIPF